MNRTLSGVLLIGLGALVLYLWASGRLNGLTSFVAAKAQGKTTRPYVIGGREAVAGGGGGGGRMS